MWYCGTCDETYKVSFLGHGTFFPRKLYIDQAVQKHLHSHTAARVQGGKGFSQCPWKGYVEVFVGAAEPCRIHLFFRHLRAGHEGAFHEFGFTAHEMDYSSDVVQHSFTAPSFKCLQALCNPIYSIQIHIAGGFTGSAILTLCNAMDKKDARMTNDMIMPSADACGCHSLRTLWIFSLPKRKNAWSNPFNAPTYCKDLQSMLSVGQTLIRAK